MIFSNEASVQYAITLLYKTVSMICIAAFLFFFASFCRAMVCPDILPADTLTLGNIKLCKYPYKGKSENFACQDIVVQDQQYRVLFKGGQTPRLILATGIADDQDMVVWPGKKSDHKPTCSFPVPEQLPPSARFMGAGICETEDNIKTPCSVFRDKTSRRQEIAEYLVLYNTAGNGPEFVSLIHVQVNRDAVPAEFAYQIGLELLGSSCCQQSGLDYLKYAYLLFPNSVIYRAAYLEGIEKLIVEKKASIASTDLIHQIP